MVADPAVLPPSLDDFDLVILRVAPGQEVDDSLSHWVAQTWPRKILLIANNPALAMLLRQSTARMISFFAAPFFAEELVARVSEMMAGSPTVTPSVIETQQDLHRQAGDVKALELFLTQRERQILNAIASGWDNARLAEEFSLKDQTVRRYVSDLYAKLGLDSRCQAVVWAREHGFGMPQRVT